MRRLTGDELLQPEFATTWPTYDLDTKTKALLAYASKLTQAPMLVEDADVDVLRAVGWSELAIYEATALVAFYNFTGRLEAASGLPIDDPPPTAKALRRLGPAIRK